MPPVGTRVDQPLDGGGGVVDLERDADAVARPAVRLDPVDQGDLAGVRQLEGRLARLQDRRRARRPRPRTPRARSARGGRGRTERGVEFGACTTTRNCRTADGGTKRRGRRGDRARQHARKVGAPRTVVGPRFQGGEHRSAMRCAHARRRAGGRCRPAAGAPRPHGRCGTDGGMPPARVRRPGPSPRRSRAPARGCPGRSRRAIAAVAARTSAAASASSLVTGPARTAAIRSSNPAHRMSAFEAK